jgi:SAM-dependent methyltransferase
MKLLWIPNELVWAGSEHLDLDLVAVYDRKAGPSTISEDIETLRRLGLDPSSVVVDMGAGTGSFVAAVAPYCRSVVAVDISPAMVALLEDKTRHLPNARVARAGFLTYRHEGDPADFIYSRNSLHHLPDLWKLVALQRVRELMVPGGVFFLRDLIFSAAQGQLQKVIQAWLSAAPADSSVGWTRRELERHLIDEHSTHSALLEIMLIKTGFEIVDACFSESKVFARYLARAI